MRERAALALPLFLAALVPLAGILLALLRLSEQRRREAGLIGAAAVLGALIWTIVLTA